MKRIVAILMCLMVSSIIWISSVQAQTNETVIPNPAPWFWQVPATLQHFLEQLYLTVYYFNLPTNMGYLLEGITNTPLATPTTITTLPTNTPQSNYPTSTPTPHLGTQQSEWNFNMFLAIDLQGWTVITGKDLSISSGTLTVYPATNEQYPEIELYNPRFQTFPSATPKVNLSLQTPQASDRQYGNSITVTLKGPNEQFKHFQATAYSGDMVDDTSQYLSKYQSVPYPGQKGIWVYVNNVEFGTPVRLNSIRVY